MNDEWTPCGTRCTCGDGDGCVVYRAVETERRSDTEYHCNSCGRNWWADNLDSTNNP